MMTFNPAKDLAEHVRLIALYDDGSEDAFAVPECTLQQGPSAAGIARLVAGEWQRDGFIKPGKIVSVRWPPRAEFVLS